MATKMASFHNMGKLEENSMNEAWWELILSNLISLLYIHQKYNFLNYGSNSKYVFAQAEQNGSWFQLQ